MPPMPLILIIDDDVTLRQAVRSSLGRTGYGVVEAANGADGVALYQLHRPALVVTDLFMPDKDGFEVILELRAIDPRVRVIAMSGGSPTMAYDLLEDARLLGATRVLSKPFGVADLLAVIDEVLADA